ncbi:MAG: DHA2 family efflux MFS transporter permease subunit [Deltaproteobacteria bacterium]|nr:DHA2 family efflux MFS transporter permease subunit [Deltaproteobacteria bacterium]
MQQPAAIPVHERISSFERPFLTLIVVTGAFMAILDTTIVEVILPKIMGPLATDIYGVQWVITAYMIAAATGLLLVEKLAASFGLKRIFLVGLLLFTSTSFLCGYANTLAQMIAFRSLQGLGEAFLIASAETILFLIYPPEKKGMAMGFYALAVSFAPALGPTLGGYITDNFSWRYVFFINVPFGVINLVAAMAFLPRLTDVRHKFRFNFTSFLLVSTATIALLTMLSKGQENGWFQSTMIIKLGVVSVAGYLAYAISEMLAREPLIDFSIFKIREYRSALGIYFFILGLSMYQGFYLLPLYYEKLRLITTFQTGLHLMPMAFCIGVCSILSGLLSDRIGPERVLVGTTVIYLWGVYFIMPQLNYYTPKLHTIFITLPFGVGLGLFFAPVTTMALEKLGEQTNLGVSLLHYIRFVGGSFGTALATNTLQRKFAFHYDETCALQNGSSHYIHMFVGKWEHLLHQLYPADLAAKKAKVLLGYATSVQALSHAFQDTFRDATIYALVGCLFLVFFFIGKKKSPFSRR